MDGRQSHGQVAELNKNLAEVWFFIEKDEDGYPESRTWEGLWSRSTSEGFEVLNVPFYLKNLSRGDLVRAVEGEFLRGTEVLRHSGHNTYRLLMHEASTQEVKDAITELQSKGLTVELNETGILIAVDVPPSVDQEDIDAYLLSNKEAGRWQMQDGYLSTIETDSGPATCTN